jgi:hypothetical protein
VSIAVRKPRPAKRLRERKRPAMLETISVAAVTAAESASVETRLRKYAGFVTIAAYVAMPSGPLAPTAVRRAIGSSQNAAKTAAAGARSQYRSYCTSLR